MDVESEKNESPHPGRATALHCPLCHLLSVWCVSVESKGITPIGTPTPGLYGTYGTRLMAAVIEMGLRTPRKKKLT